MTHALTDPGVPTAAGTTAPDTAPAAPDTAPAAAAGVVQWTAPEPRGDAGIAAQRAAEAHLEAIYLAEDHDTGGEESETADAAPPDSPACGVWCGCETCIVREVLYAAWPVLHDDIVARLRDAGFGLAAQFLEQLAADDRAADDRAADDRAADDRAADDRAADDRAADDEAKHPGAPGH